jgi:hypothetical protein
LGVAQGSSKGFWVLYLVQYLAQTIIFTLNLASPRRNRGNSRYNSLRSFHRLLPASSGADVLVTCCCCCCCCVWRLLMSRLEAVAAAVSGLSGSSGRGLDERVGAFRRGWARTDVDRPRRMRSPVKGGHGCMGTRERHRSVGLRKMYTLSGWLAGWFRC